LRDLNYWDPLHSNTVEFVEPDLAPAFPGLTAGEVVVSLRNMDFLIAVDLARKTVTAALTGGWRRQHDADLLPSGEILLFDNLGNLGPQGRSRVIQFEPGDGRITWSYTGTIERPLYSLWRSTQQRLANGNTLITESGGGRLLEVTAAGDIVWEFINPVRGGPAGDLIPIVSGGTRLSPDEVPFLRD